MVPAHVRFPALAANALGLHTVCHSELHGALASPLPTQFQLLALLLLLHAQCWGHPWVGRGHACLLSHNESDLHLTWIEMELELSLHPTKALKSSKNVFLSTWRSK